MRCQHNSQSHGSSVMGWLALENVNTDVLLNQTLINQQ